MTVGRDVRERHFAAAAVLAGAAGLGLVLLGWWMVGWQVQDGWSRLSDSSWWAGVVTRTVGFLLIGKVGFKGALVLVFAAVAATAAVRRWRSRRSPTASDDTAGPGEV